MGDAQAPGGYFVGRPANYEPQDAADAQKTWSAPPAPENHGPQQQQGQAPSSGGQEQTVPKKKGFLGGLFSCFSGGQAES